MAGKSVKICKSVSKPTKDNHYRNMTVYKHSAQMYYCGHRVWCALFSLAARKLFNGDIILVVDRSVVLVVVVHLNDKLLIHLFLKAVSLPETVDKQLTVLTAPPLLCGDSTDGFVRQGLDIGDLKSVVVLCNFPLDPSPVLSD